ncbi:MAG: S-layer protein [Nanoarchaeota archaeon]|mgnify:CR=1 FL=1
MKTRRFVKKILALGASLLVASTSILAQTSPVAKPLTLADYPSPFINQGQFDAKIVVGKNAAASDVIGAVDIAASLQGQAVEEIDIPLPSDVPLGDAYELTSKSQLFEFREGIRDVLQGGTVSSDQLDSLKTGTITGDQGSSHYNQYLRFGSGANGNSLSNWTLYYGPNDDPNEKVGDYLFVPELGNLVGGFSNLTQNALFEYELEFQDGLRSTVKSRRGKLTLKSIEQKVFNIFGTDFSLVDSTVQGTTNTTDVTLSFMGGDVVDQIQQAETKVYTIDGVDFEITALFITDPKSGDLPTVKFSINGELTQQLGAGDVDVLSQGIQIGVQSVLTGGTGGMVTFFLGVNKIEFRDTNTEDDTFSQIVRAGSERVDGGWVRILGSIIEGGANVAVQDGQVFKFDSIQYRFLPKSIRGTTNIYVPPGHGIREFLDRPQGMLNTNWDIKYAGLYPIKSQPIKVTSQGDNEYRLFFTNQENIQYNVPLAEVDQNLGLRYGRGGKSSFRFVEPFGFTGNYTTAGDNLDLASHFPINKDDYFLITNEPSGARTGNAVSKVYQYSSIDTSNKRLTITDLSSGSLTVPYTDTGLQDSLVLGTADLIVSGARHTLFIANFSNSSVSNPIAIDIDGDGVINGRKGLITTYGRASIDITGLDFTNGNWVNQTNITQGAIIVNVSTLAANMNSGGLRGGENLEVNLTTKPGLNEITMGTVTYFRNGANYNLLPNTDFRRFKLYRGSDLKDHSTAATDYGAIVDQYTPGNDVASRSIIIDYPVTERGGQVLVTGGQKKKTLQAQTLTTKKVNPIPVGFSLLDTDAPRLGTQNMIVIGGPCANRVAAQIMGNPKDCSAGFEKEKAILKLVQTGDKFALLIAGYDNTETLGASYVIAEFSKYALVGNEMEVVVKDLDHVVVTPVR